jgi:SSS family solute:Na+ symporter
MQTIDWLILGSLAAAIVFAALFTRKYTQSVAEFMAAGRCAGRYLINVSSLVAGFSTLSFVGFWEAYYQAGFSPIWWQLMNMIPGAIVAIYGWVGYRYRQTHVLTLGQFFETRYDRKFRIFAGILAWTSGMVNFGIFPAVGARFFIYFCGLPDTNLVFAAVMCCLLALSVFCTLAGGHISVIVTDFIQGTFSNLVLVLIMMFILLHFSWAQMMQSLTAGAAGDTMVNPYTSTQAKDFNIGFFLIVAFLNVYSTGVWQSSQAYNVCAINAHESRMSGILGIWRILPMFLSIFLMALGAYTFMHHPDFSALSRDAHQAIAGIHNPTIQRQVTTTTALRYFIPVGLKGAFVAVLFAAFISSHSMMLHSWGTMFVQDVVLPIRNKPLAPAQHIILLRASILTVACTVLVFSFFFRQTEFVHMYFMISASVFIAGGGAVLIGGLYWNRGTTAAAWAALSSGAALALFWIFVRQINSIKPFDGGVFGYIASVSAGTASFINTVLAIAIYVAVSLCSRRPLFNMEKMLHRGAYKIKEVEGQSASAQLTGFRKWAGMGSEFTTFDKLAYFASSGFTILITVVITAGTVYGLFFRNNAGAWLGFWRYYVLAIFSMGLITMIWFGIGGIRDLRRMFKYLKELKSDIADNGMVIDQCASTEKGHETLFSTTSEST